MLWRLLSPTHFPQKYPGNFVRLIFFLCYNGLTFPLRIKLGGRNIMIGLLSGTIVYKSESSVILDVSGVGYKVLVPQPILATLIMNGEQSKLFIYTHVREESLDLYGFAAPEDLKLFEYLIGVSGVGPKSALGVFSVGTRSDILNAIAKGDVEFFTSVPRLGKKNAQKIIIELKSKIGSTEDLDLSEGAGDSDVVRALQGFGFTQREAQRALNALDGKATTPEEQIRLALKYLGK
jgi:holliday junction DNA helicase RuvA